MVQFTVFPRNIFGHYSCHIVQTGTRHKHANTLHHRTTLLHASFSLINSTLSHPSAVIKPLSPPPSSSFPTAAASAPPVSPPPPLPPAAGTAVSLSCPGGRELARRHPRPLPPSRHRPVFRRHRSTRRHRRRLCTRQRPVCAVSSRGRGRGSGCIEGGLLRVELLGCAAGVFRRHEGRASLVGREHPAVLPSMVGHAHPGSPSLLFGAERILISLAVSGLNAEFCVFPRCYNSNDKKGFDNRTENIYQVGVDQTDYLHFMI